MKALGQIKKKNDSEYEENIAQIHKQDLGLLETEVIEGLKKDIEKKSITESL